MIPVMTLLKVIQSSKEAVLDYLESKKETKGDPAIVIRLMSEEERNSLGVPEDAIAWVHSLKKNNKPIFYETFNPSTRIFAMVQGYPFESPFISPQELMEATYEDVQKELEKRHREMIPKNEKINVIIKVPGKGEVKVTLTKREERWMMGKKQLIYDVNGDHRETRYARKKLEQSGKYPDHEILCHGWKRTIILEEKKKEETD